MSKQITAKELGQLINQLLTNPDAVGEMFTEEKFSAFMTDLANVVTDHCGGEVRNPASPLDDVWYVGVHGNDSLPPGGGVWAAYDKEGELFDASEEGDSNVAANHGEFKGHDWALGKECEDGVLVFVDDVQLSYRKTREAAKQLAFDVIERIVADGDYRLYDKPNGFMPPVLKN